MRQARDWRSCLASSLCSKLYRYPSPPSFPPPLPPHYFPSLSYVEAMLISKELRIGLSQCSALFSNPDVIARVLIYFESISLEPIPAPQGGGFYLYTAGNFEVLTGWPAKLRL